LSVEEDPSDDRNAFYYARELFFYNQYYEAAEEFKRHLSLPRATWAPERAASMRYLAKIEPDSRADWLTKAHAESPNRREALVELAQHFYQVKEWSSCLTYAQKALAIEEKPLDYLCEEFAWGALPWDLAAISSYWLDEKDKALEYGLKAAELAPSDARLQKNLEFYQS
jgi:tetratricopeptide (TPR) repeat protein